MCGKDTVTIGYEQWGTHRTMDPLVCVFLTLCRGGDFEDRLTGWCYGSLRRAPLLVGPLDRCKEAVRGRARLAGEERRAVTWRRCCGSVLDGKWRLEGL